MTASVRKTGRLVIAHEAVMPFGVGAEIAATISEQAFGQMRSPPFRVGAAFMPVPFGRSLELGYLPGKEEIVEALQRSMNWKKSA